MMNKRTMLKCPNCGEEKNIENARSMDGPTTCRNCGFSVPNKQLDKSFVIEVEEVEYEFLLEEDV